jgi:transcriptional regulator with GAF, ATPase, and Fis domain
MLGGGSLHPYRPIWDPDAHGVVCLLSVLRSGSRHQMPKNATDVARALAETARTINSPRTLAETLDAIVHAAQVSVPGFDHVGISIVHGKDKIETKAATGQLVWELDGLQYRLMEGPCVEAMFEEPIVSAPNLRHEQRWPRYVPEAVQHGVRAQLGYRLYVDGQTMGGLNFYSTVSDTLDDGACEVGELFAVHATVALGRAMEEDTLNIALTTRGLIGQAVGLTMARFEISSARAFQYLVRASSTSNIKVRDIAEEVVNQANARYDSE